MRKAGVITSSNSDFIFTPQQAKKIIDALSKGLDNFRVDRRSIIDQVTLCVRAALLRHSYEQSQVRPRAKEAQRELHCLAKGVRDTLNAMDRLHPETEVRTSPSLVDTFLA